MHVVGRSVALVGLCPQLLRVEAQLTRGLPGVELVGVPDRVAREIVVRVRAALVSTGIDPPPKHVVLNVAPGELRKSGAGLDLPVALAWLGALGFVPESAQRGPIALAGRLRRPDARRQPPNRETTHAYRLRRHRTMSS